MDYHGRAQLWALLEDLQPRPRGLKAAGIGWLAERLAGQNVLQAGRLEAAGVGRKHTASKLKRRLMMVAGWHAEDE